MTTKIQALLFKTSSGWTLPKVKLWVKNNGYKPIKKTHKTERYYRVRLISPKKKGNGFRTIYLSKDLGIKSIVQL